MYFNFYKVQNLLKLIYTVKSQVNCYCGSVNVWQKIEWGNFWYDGNFLSINLGSDFKDVVRIQQL